MSGRLALLLRLRAALAARLLLLLRLVLRVLGGGVGRGILILGVERGIEGVEGASHPDWLLR